jgi:flagellar protein FlaG
VYNATNDTVTLYVKNTGIRTLPSDASAVDLFIDGQYRTNTTMTVVDDAEWTPDAVVELTVSGVSLAAGDHRVKLVVDRDEEVFEFRT